MYFEPTHRTLHHPRILRQQNTGFVLKTNGKLCGFFELFTHSSNTKPVNQTGIGISMKLAFLMFFYHLSLFLFGLLNNHILSEALAVSSIAQIWHHGWSALKLFY
jgi:hypothetical protein